MAESYYRGMGTTIPYTPSGSSLEAGQVVDLGTLVGLAITDIADGVQGALHIHGEAEFAKYTGQVINLGDLVFWDDGTNTATTTSGYGEARIGVCVKAALAGDARVSVLLCPGIGSSL